MEAFEKAMMAAVIVWAIWATFAAVVAGWFLAIVIREFQVELRAILCSLLGIKVTLHKTVTEALAAAHKLVGWE